MSLEQAIQDNTKVLQSIATSLAVLAAKGGFTPAAPVTETKAEAPKAEEKPKAEAKAKPKAEDKPVAEKTDKELMAEVLAEEDDLLGMDEPEAEVSAPALPAGERDLKYAKDHLVTPVFSKLGREELVSVLDKFNAKRITEVPPAKWDELHAEGWKLLRSVGKV